MTFSLLTPSQDIGAPQLLRGGIDSCWEPGHLSLSSPSAAGDYVHREPEQPARDSGLPEATETNAEPWHSAPITEDGYWVTEHPYLNASE